MSVTNSKKVTRNEIAEVAMLCREVDAMMCLPEEGHYEVEHRGCTNGMWEDAYEVAEERWVVDTPSKKVPDDSKRSQVHRRLIEIAASDKSRIVRAVAASALDQDTQPDPALVSDLLSTVVELAIENRELQENSNKLRKSHKDLEEKFLRSQSRGLMARIFNL